MIVFTYAVICPVIVPFGMLYFGFSLIVYKKQILYVYQPVYESGGAMFPGALQKTLFGLSCGQLTCIGVCFRIAFWTLSIPASITYNLSFSRVPPHRIPFHPRQLHPSYFSDAATYCYSLGNELLQRTLCA